MTGIIELRETSSALWERFQSGDTSLVQAPVVHHWTRAKMLGADPDGRQQRSFVDTAQQLKARKEAAFDWLAVAEYTLTPMVQMLSQRGYVVLLGDPDGVVLRRLGGGEFAKVADRLELVEGSHWSEAARGTNGIGTTIAAASPVCVSGWAHFARDNQDMVCYGVPLHGPEGQLLGILDASAPLIAEDHLALASVVAGGQAVEANLRERWWQKVAQQGGASIQASMESWDEPALIVDPRGRLLHGNAVARRHIAFARATGAPLRELGPDWSNLLRAGLKGEVLALPTLPGELAGRVWRVELLPSEPGQAPAALVVAYENKRTPSFASEAPASGAHAMLRGNTEIGAFSAILGHDSALQRAKAVAARFATTNLPILLFAETGAGKELFARAIHEASARAKGPWVALNCGALAGELLGAELFGYAPGAFTGAHPKGRAGKLEKAHGGTLFLDEVAEMSSPLQAMLLRVLETGTFYRLGESEPRQVDVRLVCATWKNLPQMVESDQFRRDLYYRIRGASIRLPSLRERTDLRELAQGLLPGVSADVSIASIQIQGSAWPILEAHRWPGNVRELRTVLAQAAVVGDGIIDDEAVRWAIGDMQPSESPMRVSAARPLHVNGASGHSELYFDSEEASLRNLTQAAVDRALRETQGNMSEAARRLGVARSTLYRRLRKQ